MSGLAKPQLSIEIRAFQDFSYDNAKANLLSMTLTNLPKHIAEQDAKDKAFSMSIYLESIISFDTKINI